MKDKNNIFNIQANSSFFQSFFFWLENSFTKDLAQTKIFLPNHRSCRELKRIFLQQNSASQLPEIKAISDISYQDFFDFLPNDEIKPIIDEILQIKLLDNIDYLFFLADKIQNQALFGQLNFEQSFKIAPHIKELFEEIEREEIDIKKLQEIDDSNLAQHRQITLEFLKDFCIHIKYSLLKENIFSLASYQNFITQKFIFCLENYGSKKNLIIAGSTGSVLFGRKLIRAIANQKNGFVILSAANEEKISEENHPQFLLSQLLGILEIEKKVLISISNPKFEMSCEVRQKMLSLLMLPYDQTNKWQKIDAYLDVKKARTDLEENFSLIEAKNEIEEAKIISLILREKIAQNKTCGVIANNYDSVMLLKLELERLNINFNDSRNLNIFDSNLVKFLLLILEVFESDFNSHSLMALLKNSLCSYSSQKDLLAEFEIKILRKSRSMSGLSGIKEALKNEEILEKFFNNFLKEISHKSSISNLIKSAENLSDKKWLELLSIETSQLELFQLFEKLKSQNYSPDSLDGFKVILSQISYFEKSDSLAKIQILSPIEARLLSFDCIIITSLNEGNFPKIESQNWLGKKIKKDLGIDNALKKVGQNAFDFCNYLSQKSVIMTRCKSSNGALLIESPFLLKFKTISKKLEANLDLGEKYFLQIAAEKNSPQFTIKPTNPKPKKILRPQKFSITEISKLIADPYFIYCKKILSLRKLDKIDYEPTHAEFGSFIHKALEEFIKNPQQQNFEEIFEKFFPAQEAKLIWWPKFQNIFSDFLEKNHEFLSCKSFVEKPVELRINDILIRGKIDRIIFNQTGQAEIFDYKTGQIPSRKDVISGIEPQLTIAALALLESCAITSINYWKLSQLSEGEIKPISSNSQEIEFLASAAKYGLEKLFTYFENEENGYPATEEAKLNEYWHLSRIE